MAVPTELFGKGECAFDFYTWAKNDGSFSWVSYAVLVGILNGCPRPRTNVEKKVTHTFGPESSAKAYVKDHLPQNFWWGWLLDTMKQHNPVLHTAWIEYSEPVPSDIKYEPENVPANFLNNPIRLLATDAAYSLILGIHQRLTSEKHVLYEFTDIMDVVYQELLVATTVETFVANVTHILNDKFPVHPEASS